MKNNFLFIIFDSCRFDTFKSAHTPNISRLGNVEQRYSFASWTFPSHAAYLMGSGPHRAPRGVFASEVYKKDFAGWATRLNIPNVTFKDFLPRLSLPAFLKEQGYRTNALVSMPVLNQTTVLNQHFDRYELMDNHNDFNAMIDQLHFDKAASSFYLLNLGETHYPYTVFGEKSWEPPPLHGSDAIFKHSADEPVDDSSKDPNYYYNMDQVLALKEKQRKNVEYLDSLFEKLYEKVPANTYILVTADHGECFGENGYFGHGPVMHEKVFEIFSVEGRIK